LDGYDSPLGTILERESREIPPAPWHIALQYGQYYLLRGQVPAIHTGLDIALEAGGGLGAPVYAAADGVCVFSTDVTGSTWRNLVVLKHTFATGVTCTRYGHLQKRMVRVGDTVRRGQQIGTLGNADGIFAPHLHFDLGRDGTLAIDPTNWPGNNLALVRQLYLDPKSTIERNRPMPIDDIIAHAQAIIEAANQLKTPPPAPTPRTALVNGPQGNVNVRRAPGNGTVIALVKNGTALKVLDSDTAGWSQIAEGTFNGIDLAGGFIYSTYLSFQ
jgi:hypothetical protein